MGADNYWRLGANADGDQATIWNLKDDGNDCPPLESGKVRK